MVTKSLAVGLILGLAGFIALFGCAGSGKTAPFVIQTVAPPAAVVPATPAPTVLLTIPPTNLPFTATPTVTTDATATIEPAGDSIVKYVTALTGGTEPFDHPVLMAFDSQRNLYVLEEFDRIKKYDKTGKFITKWGSRGSGDGEFLFVNDNEGAFGMAIGSGDNIFVADGGNNRVQKFDPNGKFLTKWGSRGSGDGQFNLPQGVAVDSHGNVYVTDKHNDRVQVFDGDGKFLTKWGSHGDGAGQFNIAADIAVDSAGTVYVANRDSRWLEKFDKQGKFLDRWNDCRAGSKGTIEPVGLTLDRRGNILFADIAAARICEFSTDGKFLGMWGKYGSGEGEFLAMGVPNVDADGTIYIPDVQKNQIFLFKRK